MVEGAKDLFQPNLSVHKKEPKMVKSNKRTKAEIMEIPAIREGKLILLRVNDC